MSRVAAVVGGGIAGLSAAYRLQERSRALEVVLLEAGGRLGGKILTEKAEGLAIEAGPDSFITAKPQALELVRELGLERRLLPSSRDQSTVYVYVRGKLRPLPEGLMLMAPSRILPFLGSDLLTWGGKLRVGLDFLLPRGPEGDVSLGAFARRRFGGEALRVIVEPVMAGIYAADVEELSLKSSFPQFAALEKQYRSVIRGLRRRAPAAPAPSGLTMFTTLAGGLSELTEALARRLKPGSVRLGSGVVRIEPRGGRYRLGLSGGGFLDADAVIATTASWQTAKLVRGFDPGLAEVLEEIPFASTATVTLAYEAQSLDIPSGFGFVVARGEAQAVAAATFSSAKFPGRAPAGTTLIRCFLGGAGREGPLRGSDEELAIKVRQDLGRILGLGTEPILTRVYRWTRGNPQYTVGHEERLKRIAGHLERHPGLALAGASYRGIGIPDCIASAYAAAELVLDE
ncbi:MAG: protoporphyrinogen oxidase [Elusimicrobia bacterium]|nr:protoporphyrinogen oxidase [Elusimicrobiota bacterium]